MSLSLKLKSLAAGLIFKIASTCSIYIAMSNLEDSTRQTIYIYPSLSYFDFTSVFDHILRRM